MVLSPLPDPEILMDHITHQFHHGIGLNHPLPEPNTVPGTWWAFMVFLTISWHRPSWPKSCCCCSVTKSHLTLYDPWIAARRAPLSSTISQSLLRFVSIELVMLSKGCTLAISSRRLCPSYQLFSVGKKLLLIHSHIRQEKRVLNPLHAYGLSHVLSFSAEVI